jgi:hypothetical protein
MLSAPALYLFAARHTLLEFTTPLGRPLRWNLCGFALPFFVAMHWEYVGQCTGANFSLTARQLSHLNRPSQILLATGILIAAAITALCVREARRAGFLGRYLACLAGLIGTLVAITAMLGPHYYVHIHHYFWSLCLIPFVRFRNVTCLVTQGALTGIFLEGAARYGLAPIWIFHR